MSTFKPQIIWQVGVALFLTVPAIQAQHASSATYFLATGENAGGGSCSSVSYGLTGAFGNGSTAIRANSTNYLLTGGFPANLDVTIPGTPWLSGVAPSYAPLSGGTSLCLHGAELDGATSVKIGNRAATITGRHRDRVNTVMPRLTTPGWQAVEVTTPAGKSILPKGVGVLPLIEASKAILIGDDFRLTYRGMAGDVIMWMIADRTNPFTLPIAPYHHGFQLNLTCFFLFSPAKADGAGLSHLNFPKGTYFIRPLLFQAFALSSIPGFQPGSFTNLLLL